MKFFMSSPPHAPRLKLRIPKGIPLRSPSARKREQTDRISEEILQMLQEAKEAPSRESILKGYKSRSSRLI